MDEDHFSMGYSKIKKKNIFDDDVSEDAVYSLLTVGKDDISFADRFDPGPQETMTDTPDLSSLATPASRTRPTVGPETKTLNNSSTFGGASRAMEFGHNRSHSLTIGAGISASASSRQKPDMQFSSSASLHSIDKVAATSPQRSDKFSASSTSLQSIDKMDVDKMQQEIQSLKRSLLSARKDRWMKQPVEDTLRRILKGEAVLFLQKTVTRHIFTRELIQRPVAANHYLDYLKSHFEFPEYINTLL
ncbi:spermatogenesis-defective protein 39 homolog [Elysia marginata]|uniref:Spermatogenesis-defective protein 39 homolog n=1 Tax=Elysia marginata TaxID=1093978 RepID=A0AAV4J8R7_9GAST|nr:spermatogenesis-defective protein 39 homolog [Elysia marginata]